MNMDRPLSILSISYDESVLHTRAWILESAGCNVTSALGFVQAVTHCQNSAFDLIIMGHSIPGKDRESLLQVVRSHNHSRILLLRRAGQEISPGTEHSLDALEGPEALISAVKSILGR
jgi:DNA-binding response OmpR family regulator